MAQISTKMLQIILNCLKFSIVAKYRNLWATFKPFLGLFVGLFCGFIVEKI